ncbi:DUF3375 domain-containing protein [Pseudomarimonas arenosa]|uniref:DUF3375 domain-containing protein n=1 Tax=Pseudomarimonas arenosa TaxID=2774145 RepID=A0AAW3ZNV7_9GAMM|nr:DUF3375 domain-containing protein [Pseudomarimonas arenosa]MBD8527820.1 DUF3375 domain-containing protein [Pseudomarimonas arenosa]
MKPHARIATLHRLRQAPLWRLLAATNASAILGLLQCLLLDEERRLPASVLHERLNREIDALRSLGHELPQTAQAYVADWLASGWLERSLPDGASEEQYELTTAAINAIRFVAGLEQGRRAATESRLALVIEQLVRLADETETDPARRLAQLEAEQARIGAEIAELQAGRVVRVEPQRALERAREAIALADELAEDFRRVRDDFQRLNREFRERLVGEERDRGAILEALFAGVDVIAESDAGRSFAAFWNLLTDIEQSARLEEAIDAILRREFASGLQRRERAFLLHLTRTLLLRGGEVHEVLQRFARSLKGFVQSREFLEQRRLDALLKQTQATALQLRGQLRPEQPIALELQLSSARLRSLAQWRLFDPAERQVDGHVRRGETLNLSLDNIGELVAQSEIDFRRLRAHVTELLVERAQCSIGQLLARFPAEQGLGSVVGYLTLGSRQGVVSRSAFETVQWSGGDGVVRMARIPLIHFLREAPNVCA